jgi:hypothetical protein
MSMPTSSRRDRRLRAKVRVLELRVVELELSVSRASAGPPLTLENLVADYQGLRRTAVRFVRLHVAPDMLDAARAVVAEGSFRALQEFIVHEEWKPGTWELRAA